MIVVDTNVIVYLMIEGEKTNLAQQVFQKEPNWVMPLLWRHEFLNVLTTLVVHTDTTVNDAGNIWQQSMKMFAVAERDVDMLYALNLACQHKISAYDAQYIALAMTLNIPCVTEDKKLLKTFPEIAFSMESFCEK